MLWQILTLQRSSVNLKIIVLIAIYAGLVVFSLAWYHALTNINCDLTLPFSSGSVKTGSSQDTSQNCNEQLHFHWIKFYGINGLIYGASIVVFVVNMRKNHKN